MPHAHRTELIDALLLGSPVIDRPITSDQRSGGIEIRPDGIHDPRRHKVHVDIEESRQAQLGYKRGQFSIVHSDRHARITCLSDAARTRARPRGWPAFRPGPAAYRAAFYRAPARSRPWLCRP